MLSPETAKRLASFGSSEQELATALRLVFPNGHEDYLPQCIAEMELHSQKNHDYASGGDSLGNFKRVAAILGHYKGLDLSDPRVVALVYAMKQIDAVLWSLAQNITAKVEGIVPRLDDVAVYAKIVKCLTIEKARNKSIDEQFGVDLNAKQCAASGQYKPGQVMGALKEEDQGKCETSGNISRVRVSEAGRETEPAYRRRMGFDSVPGVSCPELNQTRDREDGPSNRTTPRSW